MMKLFSKSKSKEGAAAASTGSSGKESTAYHSIKEKSLDKIYKAAWNGDIKKLSSFQNDINTPDAEKRTALHLACANGQERAVDVLLSMGADARARDREDKTPLYRAVQASQALCIRLLLKKVPKLAKDEPPNSLLLHMAVQNGSTETLAALLTALADDVDAADSGGRTALMLACEAGRASMAAALLDKGASMETADSAGHTSADLAKAHPDCLKILESRRGGGRSSTVSKPVTPRNRTSSDFEDDESKSTDYDIPVPKAVSSAGRSRSPVVSLAGGRKAISLNELRQGETLVQLFDPETHKISSLKVPVVKDKRKRSRSQSPAVSLTVSVDSLGSDDEAEQNKTASRAEPPPLRKSLAAVPEAPTSSHPAAVTPKKATPMNSQPAPTKAPAAAAAASGNESDSDWSNSQSAAAPESGAKINLKLALEQRMAAKTATAGRGDNGQDNAPDDDDDDDDDDDNTVASDFPPTTAPTPRSVGKATPRDVYQRQDSDWEASEISEAPLAPKAKETTATKAEDEESDWDESVAVSAAAKPADKIGKAAAVSKLSAAREDESDWDNSVTEAPSCAAAVKPMSKSRPNLGDTGPASAISLEASARSLAKDEISDWDSATEEVASSATADLPSLRKQQQKQQENQQLTESARNQNGLQSIEEEAAIVAAAIAAAATVDSQKQQQQPPQELRVDATDSGRAAEALEFWDSEASLAASDGPPSHRPEEETKPPSPKQQQPLKSQKQPEENSKKVESLVESISDEETDNADTDEDIDFARDGGGNATIKFAGNNNGNSEHEDRKPEDRPKVVSLEAEPQSKSTGAIEARVQSNEVEPESAIRTAPAAVTLSSKPSSPREQPLPPVPDQSALIARLQSDLAIAADSLAESRAEAGRLSAQLELATNQLADSRHRQADTEANLDAARRRLEAEQAEAARLTERLRADAAGAEELVRADLRRERAVSQEASLALEAARDKLADLRRRLELEREETARLRAELQARASAVTTTGINGEASGASAAAAAADALAELRERLSETRAELAVARNARDEASAAAEAATRAARADGERAGIAETSRRLAAAAAEALAESAAAGESAPALRTRMRKLLRLADLGPEFEPTSAVQNQSEPTASETVSANQKAAPSPPPQQQQQQQQHQQQQSNEERIGLALEFTNGHDVLDVNESVTIDAVRHMSADQLRQACLQLSAACDHHRQGHDQERRLRRKLTEELQRLSNAEAHAAAALSLEKERARAIASSRAFLADAHLTGVSRLPPPPPPLQPPAAGQMAPLLPLQGQSTQQQQQQQQQQQLDAYLLERLRAELNRSISKHLESEDAARRNLAMAGRARSNTRVPEAGIASESDFSYLTYLKRKYLV